MKWALPVVLAIAAVVAAFALAGPDDPEPGPTFAWAGEAGEPLPAGVYARVVRRQGVQARTLAELASTVESDGERQLVVTGRSHDGAAMLAAGTARGARLTTLGSFVPVADLGAARVSPKGVHPLGGWDAKREFVGDRAVVRFEAGGGPRPDRVGWASVVGLVRSDVRRLVAELADGSRSELPVNRWRGFGYRAAPETAALALLAYDRDGALLERAELHRPTPLCGGAYGPCDPELAQYLD
jgi:hypothetical protein